MTLDAHYLRGSMAAIYSLLKHASCPESLFFHFLAAADAPFPAPAPGVAELRTALAASFPSLRFEIYPFRPDAMTGLISASMRAALEAPLNNARNHLADLLAVDDVRRLWETRLQAAAVVGFIRGREVGGEEVEEGRREGGGCWEEKKLGTWGWGCGRRWSGCGDSRIGGRWRGRGGYWAKYPRRFQSTLAGHYWKVHLGALGPTYPRRFQF
jgi:hypothetical protein